MNKMQLLRQWFARRCLSSCDKFKLKRIDAMLSFQPSKRSSNLLLLGILLISLVLRLGVFSIVAQTPAKFLATDSKGYDGSARSLLLLHRFSVAPENPNEPMVVRTPVYPLMLAAIHAVFGLSVTPVILVQIILSLLTILVMYWMSSAIGGRVVGILATCLFAL